jgi:hypothetical protein
MTITEVTKLVGTMWNNMAMEERMKYKTLMPGKPTKTD